jgi:hypothetical protein
MTNNYSGLSDQLQQIADGFLQAFDDMDYNATCHHYAHLLRVIKSEKERVQKGFQEEESELKTFFESLNPAN